VLGDLAPVKAGKGAPAPPAAPEAPSLDAVFQQFREEAGAQPAEDVAAQQFQLGQSYRKMGQLDDAIAAFEKAARSLRHRFRAAALLGQIYRDKGAVPRSLDWLERAAEAPAPTEDEHHALLYDLGETLERLGETARALAVFLELQADAGSYRDVAQKVDRLARV
jgi:tetratricopeptide (TPR) repeat protein